MSAGRLCVTAAAFVCGVGGSLVLAAPAQAVVRCGGERATIVGTAAADTLVGTSGHDVIAGQDGDDTINGGGGRDLICGEAGSDRLSAGPGGDRVFGGPDQLTTVDGTTRLVGDTLLGGPGDDRLVPVFDERAADQRSRDVLSWETATRRVRVDLANGVAVGHGRDSFATTPTQVVGSKFADLVEGSGQPNVIAGKGGADEVRAGAGNDTVLVENSADSVRGGDGNDRITSRPGDAIPRIFAGAGNDTVDAAFRYTPDQDQVLATGPGRDHLILVDQVPATEDFPTAFFDMATGEVEYRNRSPQEAPPVHMSATDVEVFTYVADDSPAQWTVWGSNANERVHGEQTNGTFFQGRVGDDTLWASPGNDTFWGGRDVDTGFGLVGTDNCENVERFPDGGTCG